ncbi:MAG: T9SS type A sorting domain-containing protein [Saprospiraceae bacterium]|nr:T9SS type A sorting domain-containing protein [Saprospiraceae bacterium]
MKAFGNGLTIQNCGALVNLAGLDSLKHLGGTLILRGNASLNNLKALENIDYNSITHLTLENMNQLSVCVVQNICDYIDAGKPAAISNNAPGCNSVAEVKAACDAYPCPPGKVELKTQGQVDNFALFYPGCDMINGNLIIESAPNNAISNLNGLSALTTVGGYLFIRGNKALNDLEGLNALETIGGLFRLQDNNVASVKGLENLSTVGGSIFLFQNPELTDLTAFSSLTSTGGYLRIQSQNNLETLDGFSALNSIGGDLWIENNPKLVNLTGLSNLSTINGVVSIRLNGALTTLAGLDNISPSSISGLTILNSGLLSECAVQSICEYLANGGSGTVSGNATGCADITELKTQCLIDTDEVAEGVFGIYPNPAKEWLFVQTATPHNAILEIRDQWGRVVRAHHLNDGLTSLYIGNLPAATYIVLLRSNDEVSLRKLVKE